MVLIRMQKYHLKSILSVEQYFKKLKNSHY